jgi:hypothetical protein
MTRPRASTAARPQRPNPPHRSGLPGWAVLVIVVCAVGGVTIAAHCFGIEAESLAKVILAVTGLVAALGIGAVGAGAARRRRSRQRRNP